MPSVKQIQNPQTKYCKDKDCLCICLTCKGRIGKDTPLCHSCFHCIPLFVSKPNGKSYNAKMPDKLECGRYNGV